MNNLFRRLSGLMSGICVGVGISSGAWLFVAIAAVAFVFFAVMDYG